MVGNKISSRSTRKRLVFGSSLAVGACVAVCSIPVLFGVLGLGVATSLVCTPQEALVAASLSGLVAASLFAVRQRLISSKCACASERVASSLPQIPIACDLTVFNESERAKHMALARSLWAEAKEIIEYKDGFTFVFQESPPLEKQIVSWIANERKCCPFFSFEISRAPSTLRLHISGPDGAKKILAAELENMHLLARSDFISSITILEGHQIGHEEGRVNGE